MAIVIEKGIAIPTGGKRNKYPLVDMQVGDSFLVADVKNTTLTSAVCGFQRRHPGFKFRVRKVEGGLRVWCTEIPKATK